jgi:hypothetical protein
LATQSWGEKQTLGQEQEQEQEQEEEEAGGRVLFDRPPLDPVVVVVAVVVAA